MIIIYMELQKFIRMKNDTQRLFLDTSYIIALASKKDIYSKIAHTLSNDVKKVKEIWTHEGIVLEIV